MPNLISSVSPFFRFDSVCFVLWLLLLIIGGWGLLDKKLYYQCILHPFVVGKGNQVYRLLTSGFVHNSFSHLFLNLIILFIFGFQLEAELVQSGHNGHLQFTAIFILSIILGNLVMVYIHHKNFYYSSTGSSGGVLAIMVSYLLFNLKMTPVHIPLAGAITNFEYLGIYLGATIFMSLKGKKSQISHELHLFGCLAGISITLILHPHLIHQLK